MSESRITLKDLEELADQLRNLFSRHRNLVKACNIWKQELLYNTRGQRSFTIAEERIFSALNEEPNND